MVAQDDWYRRAELALGKGEEELAREALKRRKAYAVRTAPCTGIVSAKVVGFRAAIWAGVPESACYCAGQRGADEGAAGPAEEGYGHVDHQHQARAYP